MRNPFRSKYKITQEYGVNEVYYKQFGLKGHEGLDIVPTGSVWDVTALEDGVVVKDEDNARSGAYGIYVTLWHTSLNKATQYCHLVENYVSNGDRVVKGQKIGTMGSTGNSTGAHLHLNLFDTDTNGVRLNKNNGFLGGINPLIWLEEPDDQQALIDQLRKERDDNHNKYLEILADRDGIKAELDHYVAFRNILSEVLKCDNQLPAILGAIDKFITIEDTLTALQKEVDPLKQTLIEKESKISSMDIAITQLKQQLAVLSDVEKANIELSATIGSLLREVETLKSKQPKCTLWLAIKNLRK